MLDAFVERHTRTARGNQILIGLRLLLAMLSLVVLVIQEYDLLAALPRGARVLAAPMYLRPPGLVAVIVCVLTVLYTLVARRCRRAPTLAPKLAFLQIFVDIFLISGLVWNTGGVESQFAVLYLFPISAAALLLKWNVSILAAATCTVLFSIVAMTYSVGVVPESIRNDALYLARRHLLSGFGFLRFLMLHVSGFFLTGILAGLLSRRLEVSRLLREDILEGIGEAILLVDRARHISYHNQQFVRLLSLTEDPYSLSLERMLGRSIVQQVEEVLQQNSPRRTEISYRRPDGAIGALGIRIMPIADPGSPPHGVILALDDITAEKKMEEFNKHRQRIETMGQLSVTIAHEIRNPLSSIHGAVQELLRVPELPESKKVLLDIVLSESDRVDQIITEFLHFARMRSPGLVKTDLGRLLSDVQFLLKSHPEAGETEIVIENTVTEPFAADAEQLKQVFLNLGVNALQAMQNTSRRKLLTLRARPAARQAAAAEFGGRPALDRPDGPGVLLEIEDAGEGIPVSKRGQIFEPFFTTKPAGTGLGLAIVERIVQVHEGLISVESAEGYGTTFLIWLPADLKVGTMFVGPQPVLAV